MIKMYKKRLVYNLKKDLFIICGLFNLLQMRVSQAPKESRLSRTKSAPF